MRKELEHYSIGDSRGGNQDWFEDDWMKRGGCGAVTACECCIYFARQRGLRALYPFEAENVTREDFLAFGMRMKPYLSPRAHGINKTGLFMDGFREYLASRPDVGLRMTSLEGDAPYEDAAKAVRAQIDAGFPVPYLMLLHTDETFSDFNWHWFVLNGYAETPDSLCVRALTYGAESWMDLQRLWNTGHEEKGGLVLFSLEAPGAEKPGLY